MEPILFKDFAHITIMLNDKKAIDCVFILSPGKYAGGAERYVQNLAHELYVAHNTSVIIAVSHNREFYLRCKSTEIPTLYLGDTLKEASLALSRILNDLEIKAVISNGYHSSYLSFLSRCRSLFRERQCKFIDVKHGWITTNFQECLKTFLDKLIASSHNFVILVDPSMKRKLWWISEKRLCFIPSGVKVKRKVIGQRRGNSLFKILLIGRLSEEKRYGLALKALAKLKDRKWRLIIVGDGPEKDSLKQIVFEEGLNNRVHFAGYQHDVESFYHSTNLLVISSVSEGCPLVALEAMAHGVPVLSTSVGYMTTLLSGQRGFLVDINVTPENLSWQAKDIIALDSRAINQILHNARNYINRYHNLGKSAEIFKSLIFGSTNI